MPDQALTLTRHWMADQRPKSLAEDRAAQRSATVTGFPPIPTAALPWLRLHLTGHARNIDGRIGWHHSSGREWSAVLDLHRRGNDTAATELAQFLRWTEARGSHDDHTCWVISDAVRVAA